MVVASVAAALSISTANLRSESDRADRFAALRLAESELHRQAALMRVSGQWRSDWTSGVFSPWRALTIDGADLSSGAQVRHRLTDSDGDLSDSDIDSVELTVHAKVGSAQAAIAATLEPDPIAYDLLRYAVTATDDLQLDSGGVLTAERPIQVADSCKTFSSGVIVTPQLECSGSVYPTLRGDLSAANVTLPSRNVVNDYIARGTEIPNAAVPRSLGRLLIRDVVLSAGNNPFGSTDPNGIYWLDADGRQVIIANCRLEATLVVKDASVTQFSGGLNWTYPNQPDAAFVSNSPIFMIMMDSTLDESDRGVNFNPPSSPYRGTLSDSDTDDVYATEIRGVVYSTRNIWIEPLDDDAALSITGSIIGRDISSRALLHVRQLDELLSAPPLGLSDPTPMRFVRGSQRRIPAP
ncbi:MAG: hypothetical protein MI861_08410, partial [Pirellulales bacterium]|nr:hypothetical protein [Pirellulales bacterium]